MAPRIIINIKYAEKETELFLDFFYTNKTVKYRDLETDCGYYVYAKKQTVKLSGVLKTAIVFERGAYSHFFRNDNEADLRLNIETRDFLIDYGEDLIKRGFELRLDNKIITSFGELRFSVSSNLDWFGVKAALSDEQGGLSTLHFDQAFAQCGLIQAGDGYKILNLHDLQQLKYLRKQGMSADGLLETSALNFSLIDSIYEKVINKDESDLKANRRIFKKISDLGSIPQVDQAAAFRTALRNYQQQGLNWMVFLKRNGINGCLADDMGLGKTIQTLALLSYLKESRDLKTSLLITPVVTLANWESEITTFTPDISFMRHAGPGRTDSPAELMKQDLVIVNYHTLRNDIELFLQVRFDYIILDEAHYIKNPSSRIFKAVRLLRSKHRISLTGTPLENNTLELWSQMDFLNPGLLGSKRFFRNNFALPIEKHEDEQAAENLKSLVAPFILRRTKEQVLDDLPPKEEIVYYSEMASDQADVYDEAKDRFRQEILNHGEDNPGGQNSLDIFLYLLKLRQIAILPAMADPKYKKISSCKLDTLNELLSEIMDGRHKALIFSSFIGSLENVASMCRKEGWKHTLLIGKTKDRGRVIKEFQQDPLMKVFLLSLKAGGVGINLTQADYVFLLDPWWNPAAEKQAVDRAHRIGQKRKVISYKMIVRGSIEEKILQLQQRKNRLADSLITTDSNFVNKLSFDELIELFE